MIRASLLAPIAQMSSPPRLWPGRCPARRGRRLLIRTFTFVVFVPMAPKGLPFGATTFCPQATTTVLKTTTDLKPFQPPRRRSDHPILPGCRNRFGRRGTTRRPSGLFGVTMRLSFSTHPCGSRTPVAPPPRDLCRRLLGVAAGKRAVSSTSQPSEKDYPNSLLILTLRNSATTGNYFSSRGASCEPHGGWPSHHSHCGNACSAPLSLPLRRPRGRPHHLSPVSTPPL